MATLPLILFLSPDDAPDTGIAQAAPMMGIRPRESAADLPYFDAIVRNVVAIKKKRYRSY
jgi:hypothetical protein